ncbi:hypothetical protein EWM64_g8163 [Hericium alpestre]|uniref:Synaptobrevin homolog YKT6 n=1 Tax=Hericium alpestre TaxID=135208 RepID=A0A4Y9ZPU7_9AGAM|nr:hypothetical protein EWM64_g8163 [Hericium alpestre]
MSLGPTILAEHKAGQRDFSQATQTILSRIPPNNSKLTYVWEQYLFHYISEGGFTYLVMADDSAGRRMPFTFLGEMQQKFVATPSTSNLSGPLAPHALQASFRAAHSPSSSAQVKDIMVQNVEQILSRGERIELLVDKTDNMASQATAFRRGARTVRRQMWWRNKRVVALGFLVALVILWIIIAQFCGAGLNQCGGSANAGAALYE